MEELCKYMKISELSKLSGVPLEKIRYYLQQEILPKPIKINRTSALYNKQHLRRLELIKKLHNENKLPIAAIKETIDSAIEIEGRGSTTQPENPSIVREQLIASSIEVFRKKGYGGTTITNIVEAANMSRNTFYRYFKGKEELFIECLNEIFFGWRREVPKDHSPMTELTVRHRISKMFVAVHKAYPRWIDMMNLLRVAALKHPETFKSKLQNALDTRIKPVVDEVNEWIQQGILRPVNSELLAIMLAGIAEYVCYYIYEGKFSQEPYEIGGQMVDILFRGALMPRGEEKESRNHQLLVQTS